MEKGHLEEIIKKYKIDLKHKPLDPSHLENSSYIIIRHAYSHYNYLA